LNRKKVKAEELASGNYIRRQQETAADGSSRMSALIRDSARAIHTFLPEVLHMFPALEDESSGQIQ